MDAISATTATVQDVTVTNISAKSVSVDME
jgi:hypothetical protein